MGGFLKKKKRGWSGGGEKGGQRGDGEPRPFISKEAPKTNGHGGKKSKKGKRPRGGGS